VPHDEPILEPTTPGNSEGAPASGEALFLANLDLINRVLGFVCHRHHLNPGDAEEFASHARLELIVNNYAILRKFQGRSSLKTYLSITLQRIFFDYRIAAWGKWRPSAEARRRGPVAILVEQLIGRDSYTLDEAFEMVTINHGVAVAREELENLVAHLPARAKRHFESEDALATVPSSDTADKGAIAAEQRWAAARIADALEAQLATIAPQDRLILRLRFDDGRTVAEIAAMLRLESKPLYRRLERILHDLRIGLEGRGVEPDTVSTLLREAALEMPTLAAGQEIGMARPSMPRGGDA
jgi:RNA polymerase sigma factor (sigma-70 family)